MTQTPHPTDTGPEYRDADGQPARLVKCPDCGQMEWWTEAESIDHGRCRTGQYPCACDEVEWEEKNAADKGKTRVSGGIKQYWSETLQRYVAIPE